MIEPAETAVDLHRFFERALRATFRDLAVHDDLAAAYLADLLTRFARTDDLYPKGAVLPRLETVVDMILEIGAAWQVASPHFAPEREVTVRRHLGDYTLFMTGIFRDHMQRMDVVGFYEAEGRRAYRFVFETARAEGDGDAPLYLRLSERFEHYSGALTYMRKVYFLDRAPWTAPPDDGFFRRLVTR